MWTEKDNALMAELKFEDFVQAFGFMTQVAIIAEKQGHHPEWSNVYSTVNFRLTTHDAGDIVTDKDHKLAEAISKIYKTYQ